MESTGNNRKCLRRGSMATKSAQTPGHKLARALRFKTRKLKQKRNGQHEDDPGISSSYESQNSNPIALDNPSNPALSNSRYLLITTVPKSLVLFEGSKVLSADFFQIDALELAPRLLGKLLRRDDVLLQITEVEAYRPNDTACHGRFGITARTAPVFGPGGHAYVYLCYGLHTMLNVVADKEGVGAAVLIRSCAPISGLETIQQRRGLKTDKPVLLAGPGKVGQALGISVAWSNHPLYIPGGLEILEGPIPEKILIGPRVGIEYASPEHVHALWRFAIADSPWISAPKNTLRPP